MAAIHSTRVFADARFCRNECLIRAHIYAPPGISIHGWLDLISCHRIAFSSALAGNQIVGSVLPAVVKADLGTQHISTCHGPASLTAALGLPMDCLIRLAAS
jgi:hypothetical protein